METNSTITSLAHGSSILNKRIGDTYGSTEVIQVLLAKTSAETVYMKGSFRFAMIFKTQDFLAGIAPPYDNTAIHPRGCLAIVAAQGEVQDY